MATVFIHKIVKNWFTHMKTNGNIAILFLQAEFLAVEFVLYIAVIS